MRQTRTNKIIATAVALSITLSIPTTASAFDFGFKEGSADASGAVTGAAGADGAQNAAPKLEKCAKPIGKIAVYEPQDAVQKVLLSFKLPSPSGLIRLLIQQSNCFMVVERGAGMQNIMQERQLAEGGVSRKGSNMGKGQLAAADYVLTPEVVFSEGNAGGAGGALMAIGGMFGPLGAIAGAVAGGVKFKQAQTTLVLSDTRSGVQVAAAQGSSEKADWGIGGALGGSGAVAGLGAYESTAEGKVVASAFLDSWNNIVRSVRGTGELVRSDKSLKQEAATVAVAGAVFNDGDVVQPKLAKIRVMADASAKARVVAQFTRSVEAVVTGADKDGFIFVKGDGFEGWVEKSLIRKVGG